jgi:hypothetical protein
MTEQEAEALRHQREWTGKLLATAERVEAHAKRARTEYNFEMRVLRALEARKGVAK